uniref:Uncharacterized protein n=1 Tax=Oryzias melastigma TaxID=30732 RepID=A0A3B3D6T5_ORYME
MLHHQDLNSAFGDADDSPSPPLQNRKCDKDRNFNFLPEKGDDFLPGDENRNQMRPRNLALGRDPPSSSSSPSSGYQLNAGLKSPRSRLPCWDRIGVGEPKLGPTDEASNLEGALCLPGDQSSDSDGELPELMDTVWTLRDRERFKVQEMEKHQAQLTMYRRLALIRWVRTLQSRVQEQQNRLQSSFDVILTHRKELCVQQRCPLRPSQANVHRDTGPAL